jgi:hypothetical protein
MPKRQLEYDARMEEEESFRRAHLRNAEEELLWWNRIVIEEYNLHMSIQEVAPLPLCETHTVRREHRCGKHEPWYAWCQREGGGRGHSRFTMVPINHCIIS